jgi:1,4-dihydroxy-2-naphthoate octaprenyltransferase
VLGILPWPTLIALGTVPLAWKAGKGLQKNHSLPYRLIPSNAYTVFTHLYTGLLLFAGYVAAGLF